MPADAADEWSSKTRTRAWAYYLHRTRRDIEPAPSIAPMSRLDFVRLIEVWIGGWPGLALFLHKGVVALRGMRRG